MGVTATRKLVYLNNQMSLRHLFFRELVRIVYRTNEREKEVFRQKIIKGAQLFNKYLLNKKFIVIADDYKIYEITFKKKEFLHLTGLSVNIGANLFYDLCKKAKISKNNINDFQKHNRNTLMTKTTNIEKLIKFIYADVSTNLILKNFVMSSSPNTPFPCTIENPKENMVVTFARTNNSSLKAKSLRKKTNNEVFESSHLILAIFSQEEHEKLASSIVYIKNAHIVSCCPNIDKYISSNILDKLSKY